MRCFLKNGFIVKYIYQNLTQMKTNLISATAIAVLVMLLSPSETKAVKAPFPIAQKAILAQSFSYFKVHRMADDASLNWGVTDPQAALSFTIWRSYDGVYFEQLDEVEATGYATYKYRDNTVFPGTIYYYVVAHQADGTVASGTEVLRIVKRK
jgi:hypothetical protein